jgi:hypothetical protein
VYTDTKAQLFEGCVYRHQGRAVSNLQSAMPADVALFDFGDHSLK